MTMMNGPRTERRFPSIFFDIIVPPCSLQCPMNLANEQRMEIATLTSALLADGCDRKISSLLAVEAWEAMCVEIERLEKRIDERRVSFPLNDPPDGYFGKMKAQFAAELALEAHKASLAKLNR